MKFPFGSVNYRGNQSSIVSSKQLLADRMSLVLCSMNTMLIQSNISNTNQCNMLVWMITFTVKLVLFKIVMLGHRMKHSVVIWHMDKFHQKTSCPFKNSVNSICCCKYNKLRASFICLLLKWVVLSKQPNCIWALPHSDCRPPVYRKLTSQTLYQTFLIMYSKLSCKTFEW